ncbi:MAG: [FeFe] hydrogenase H-cluster maturation GTPase HydF [Lachnospiraceae bacterium]|nr:[FeFe] hydrogenase H-cluster maturation GTPase HydF [Lachnospiraceae bacterium]
MAGLNETPRGERIHISFLGRRNVGKSSLVNAFVGQELSIVSDVKGTTTDPVYKSMELLPIGPVIIIDTPGMDDEGNLGELRVKKTMQVLSKTDMALIIVEAGQPLQKEDVELLKLVKEREIPYLLVGNKSDLTDGVSGDKHNGIFVSAKTGKGIEQLKEACIKYLKNETEEKHIVADLLSPGDVVVLVVPIDASAPKGRLILPQQQTIRDIIEAGANALVCRDTELEETFSKLKENPRLVITDSQVFGSVNRIVPKEVMLTSFSVLMARYKGDLPLLVKGASFVDKLQKGDKVLIAEGCTHHRQCEDIGTVKIPNWLKNHIGKDVECCFVSGTEFPENVEDYRLIIHCGGCMLNEREMKYRSTLCKNKGIAVTNYGTFIAYINGILPRVVEPFGLYL